MTKETLAHDLVLKIRKGFCEIGFLVDPISDTDAIDLILAHDDEIRRECLNKTVAYLLKHRAYITYPASDGSGVKSVLRYDVNENDLRAAIMGKEEP